MQCVPTGFVAAWDDLCSLPAAAIERLMKAQLKHVTGSAPSGVSVSDVLRALGKATKGAEQADMQPLLAWARNTRAVTAVVSLIRLIAVDVLTLQIADGSAFSKKFTRVLAKQRDVGDADVATIDIIGACLSEEAIAIDGSSVRLGGAATFLSCTDVGVEEVLGSGAKRAYISGYAVGTSTPYDPTVFSSPITTASASKLCV
jgi:hypothetical protein